MLINIHENLNLASVLEVMSVRLVVSSTLNMTINIRAKC